MLVRGVVVALIRLTGVDGQVIELNPASIIMLGPPRIKSTLHEDSRCIITTSDGHFVAVLEDCATVRERIVSPPVIR